jgi:hypothetical protein
MLAWRQARSPAQERARIIDVPEYLAPGVYVEETGYRSKAIEGCRPAPVASPVSWSAFCWV